MKPTPGEQRLLRAVIRGERPWADLQDIGIGITMDSESCQVENPRRLAFAVTLEDLAHGVLKLRASPGTLRRWAWFVQSSSSIYELDIEGDVRGELFLEALWDLAFGGKTSPKIFEIAADLVGRPAE
jgi:hypothetical protein